MSSQNSSNTQSPLEQWQNIPTELKNLPQWCVAGVDKAPYYLNQTQLIRSSVIESCTWLSFDIACQVAEQNNLGIGFVLTEQDVFSCIDLDVVDVGSQKAKNQEVDPSKWTTPEQMHRYQIIINQFDSYAEYSRSGKGVHIWVKGKIGKGCRRDGVEIYSQERFIIFTGSTMLDQPIAERQELLDCLVAEIRNQQSGSTQTQELVEIAPNENDEAIWQRARKAENAEKLIALCEGRWKELQYPSQSEADMALISIIAFYTHSNQQCLQMFRMTELGKRDKANKNDRYLNGILGKVRASQKQEQDKLNSIQIASSFFTQGHNTMNQHTENTVQVSIEDNSYFQNRIPQDIVKKAIPKPFNLNEVPPPIAKLAKAFSEATGVDHSGVMVAAIVAAAAVIDDRIKLEVRKESSWSVSARLWVFLCASPSAGKSPIIRVATDPIKNIQAERYKAWMTSNEHLSHEDKLPFQALFTSDATVAALSERLKDSHGGILMLNEEFSSWIGSIDCASQGEAAKNRGDWLQLRDGGSRQIDRIGRGSVYVPNWGASVLAACTPDGLQKQMRNMPEDGLIQRFIPCIMGPSNLDATGDCREAVSEWEAKIKWAYMLTSMAPEGTIRLSSQAQKLFDQEDKQQRLSVRSFEELSPSFASHLGKHPGMLAEVALIFHMFSGSECPSAEIDADTMKIAIRFMRRVRHHAYYLYSTILTSTPAFGLAQAIARSLSAAEEPLSTIGRDWMTQHCAQFKRSDDRTRKEAVQYLEDMDWLGAKSAQRSYSGWPTQYAVNPKIFPLYAAQGEKWRNRRDAVRKLITDEDDT